NQEVYVITQRVLTQSEMRMLLPLLVTPLCCQQAVLQVSYSCEYEFLLQILLSADGWVTNARWNDLVQQQRNLLHLAAENKSQRNEMRGVYNSIYCLRRKLEQLGLTIRQRKEGYYLVLLERKE